MGEAFSAWVPPSLLGACFLAVMAVLFRKGDALLSKMIARIEALEKQSHTFATIEQLGRMGDRLDGRTTNNSERIAVLEALSKR